MAILITSLSATKSFPVPYFERRLYISRRLCRKRLTFANETNFRAYSCDDRVFACFKR